MNFWHVAILHETVSTYVITVSTLLVNDLGVVPGLLPAYLTRVQRSRMRLKQSKAKRTKTKQSGRWPGNEANKLPRPAFEEELLLFQETWASNCHTTYCICDCCGCTIAGNGPCQALHLCLLWISTFELCVPKDKEN